MGLLNFPKFNLCVESFANPLCPKNTHKKLRWGFDVLLQMLGLV